MPVLSEIFSRLSYLHVYVIVCSVCFVSFLPIGYFWIVNHKEQLLFLEDQMADLKQGQLLEKLFILVQQHRLQLVRPPAHGPVDEGAHEARLSEQQLEQEIDDALRNATRMPPSEASRGNPSVWQYLQLQILDKKWNALTQQANRTEPTEAIALHTAILNELLVQFAALGQVVDVESAGLSEHALLIQNTMLRVPSLQEALAQLRLFIESHPTLPLTREDRQALSRLIAPVEAEIGSLYQSLIFKKEGETIAGHPSFSELLEKFVHSLDLLVAKLKGEGSDGWAPSSVAQLDLVMRGGEALWEEGSQVLIEIMRGEHARLQFQLWSIVLLTLILALSGFLLGWHLINNGMQRLQALTLATRKVAEGDFSVRLPPGYHDQIGEQTVAFNAMAEKLHDSMSNLLLLLNATKGLSSGDLSTRIALPVKGEEFNEVARSFNQMASHFQTVIDRLQQGSRLLNASADRIAAAATAHEQHVIEQEHATQEIERSAAAISQNAQTFASALEQVSRAASNTSSLAHEGRGSLETMGTMIGQIIAGAETVANKLGVLEQRGEQIQTIVTMMGKFADQTNLLSLNAAIEAENAGEYGRGFGVIAREVRRLADQTAAAALEIEHKVSEMRHSVRESVGSVEAFAQGVETSAARADALSKQMGTIISEVEHLTAHFEGVSRTMGDQALGAQEIHNALAQLAQIAGNTAQAMRALQTTIQELHSAAHDLQHLANSP